MNVRNVSGLVGLLAVLAVVLTSAPSRAACPESQYKLVQMPDYAFTSAATLDTTVNDSRAAFDLRAGTIYLEQPGVLGVNLQARDAYDVLGVPPGTPVVVTAEMVVDAAIWTLGCGGSGCGGYVHAYVKHGAQVDDELFQRSFFNGRHEATLLVSLAVTIVAGQPETITFEINAGRNPGGAHASSGAGRIRFTGLPSGVVVTSCQGFSGGVVPARPTSWGRLKQIYR